MMSATQTPIPARKEREPAIQFVEYTMQSIKASNKSPTELIKLICGVITLNEKPAVLLWLY